MRASESKRFKSPSALRLCDCEAMMEAARSWSCVAVSLCSFIVCAVSCGLPAIVEGGSTRLSLHTTRSPTDNKGDWTDGAGAYGDAGTSAVSVETNAFHEFFDFNFDLPQQALITGIVVEDDSWYSGHIAQPEITILLSWDGGYNWTSGVSHSLESAELTYPTGSPTGTWGEKWLPGELNSSDFRVAVKSASGLIVQGSSFRLDWIRVTIHYTVPFDDTPPLLQLQSPRPEVYRCGLGIPIRYSVSDNISVDKCWYTIDGSNATSLPACDGTTLDVREGHHRLDVYARDWCGNVQHGCVSFTVDSAPEQPILAIYDRSMPGNYYDHYISEIMKVEGVMGFQVVDLSDYRSGSYPLTKYDVIIVLATSTLTRNETSELDAYVAGGGSLIGIKPNPQLADLFGVVALNTAMAGGYVAVDTSTAIGRGIELQPIQYHSDADLYHLNGAHALAWICERRDRPTEHPAVTVNNYGAGNTVLFTYPLVKTVVLLHQGNDELPDLTDADGDGIYRPQDYFANGFYDPVNATIPQADEHQSLLVNSVYHLMSDKMPVPRLWYLPGGAKAMCLIQSDSGGDDGGRDVELEFHSNIVETYGGRSHYNILDLDMSVRQWAVLINDEHTVSPHVYVGDRPSLDSMRSGIRRDVNDFLRKYGRMGRTQVTHSNVFPGYWESAKYFSDCGLKMSTQNGAPIKDYPHYGYMMGSALPFRIVKNEEGNDIVDAYQLPIVMSDMVMIEYGNYTESEAMEIVENLLDDLVNNYHGVARLNFHANGVYSNNGHYETRWFTSCLELCRDKSIPMLSSDRFYHFWMDRMTTEFHDIRYDDSLFTCRIIGAPDSARLAVPSELSELRVDCIEVDSDETGYEVVEIDGRYYAMFAISAPDCNVAVHYRSSESVSGQACRLLQNVPNPFCAPSGTNIRYEAEKNGEVEILIFDAAGRLVGTLCDRAREGINAVFWSGIRQNGDYVAPGVYFYQLNAEGFHGQRKMILVY